MKTRAGVLLAALALAACGQDDGFWPGCHGNICVPALNDSCRIVIGADLLCTLRDNFGVDVTAEARWTVTGPAVLPVPGYVRTTGYGEIELWAQHTPTVSSPRRIGRYLADPPRAPRLFGTVYGDAVDATTKQPVANVRVTIVDGYNAGRSGISATRGGFTIEPVLTEETFTWLAEKDGYEAASGVFSIRDYNVPQPNTPQLPWRITAELRQRVPDGGETVLPLPDNGPLYARRGFVELPFSLSSGMIVPGALPAKLGQPPGTRTVAIRAYLDVPTPRTPGAPGLIATYPVVD